jgi:hypothetical protein
MSRKHGRALTLAEVIVITAALSVVVLVAGPALTKPRSVGQRTDCLSNLQRIGMACHQYSAEDPREQAIPIQMDMIRNPGSIGPTVDNGFWLTRTVNWFAWGGQSGTRAFKVTGDAGYSLAETSVPECGTTFDCVTRPDYAAGRRPLNGYIFPDPLDAFHCSADTGYPADPRIDDAPPGNALRPCWETLGNSYRGSLSCFAQGGGLSGWTGAFAFGPWGHRLSTLPDQGRLILLGEPMWFNLIGLDSSDPNVVPNLVGWHGVRMSDNLLFCDGAARMTSVLGAHVGADRWPLSADGLERNAPPIEFPDLLRSGATWRLACYPTPGAVIYGDWSQYINASNNWPWHNAYTNP